MKNLLIFGVILMLIGGIASLLLAITHAQAQQITQQPAFTQPQPQQPQMQQQIPQQPPYSNQFPQPTQNPFPPQQTYQQPQYPQQLQQQFTNQQQPTYQSNQTSQPLYNPGKVIACQNKVLSDAITSIHTLPASPAFIQNATTALDNCIMPTK